MSLEVLDLSFEKNVILNYKGPMQNRAFQFVQFFRKAILKLLNLFERMEKLN